jgi:2-amino-4-hydroxy-6-hydroxymethyldihydropteridine diphosphokinase
MPSRPKKEARAYLSIGSNSGDRIKNLSAALKHLSRSGAVRINKISPFYETSPVGPRQRPFLNAAVRIRTVLTPKALLKALKSAEKAAGRKPTFRWGPRAADLDLIAYGSEAFRSRALSVPHPEFRKRKFVLVPMKDIAPRLKVPGSRKTIARLERELTDPAQKVRLWKKQALKIL